MEATSAITGFDWISKSIHNTAQRCLQDSEGKIPDPIMIYNTMQQIVEKYLNILIN